MINITLKQLEIFSTVARKLNFSAAANSLYLTQPAISKQIRKLEEQCGEILFEQIGKKIYLTQKGKILLEYAEQVLQATQTLKENIHSSKEIISGKLRLGMTDSFQHVIFPIIADFRKSYPAVSFIVEVRGHDELLNHLMDNKVDFILMGNTKERINCVSERIVNRTLVIAASSKHPLAHKSNINLADLKNETVIVGDADTINYKLTYQLIKKLRLPSENVLQIMNFEAIKHAVKANLGIAILSRFILMSELKAKDIVELNCKALHVKADLGIFWTQHKDKKLTKAGQLFKSHLIKQLKLIIS